LPILKGFGFAVGWVMMLIIESPGFQHSRPITAMLKLGWSANACVARRG
jgi:hypothetical protein